MKGRKKIFHAITILKSNGHGGNKLKRLEKM